MTRRTISSSTLTLLTLLGAACSPAPSAPGVAAGEEAQDHDHEHEEGDEHEPMVTNRIDLPEPVRRNLGITFARVETRAVAQTLRVPGRFEFTPNARREYRTMLGGRVELLVQELDRVEPGSPLYRLDSPPWRELQLKLNEADSAIRQATARFVSLKPLMAAHKDHEERLREGVALWLERVETKEKTRESGVVTADEIAFAQTSFATVRADLAEVLEKEAELEAQRAEVTAQLEAAESSKELLIATASTLLGIPVEDLVSTNGSETDAPVRWRTIDTVVVSAIAPGVVESIQVTNGAWAAETNVVLTTVQPEMVRFRARGLQSDLGLLRDGLPALIVPPTGGSISLQDTMDGTLIVGLTADPDERTVDLLVTPRSISEWARAGVAGHLEVTLAGGKEELAIPQSAVIQSDLKKVFFRRDPEDPDKVIRVDADLDLSDGRWVVVKSGLKEGDEVVMDGVYQLMLSTADNAQKGGHFHADGTFHEGED